MLAIIVKALPLLHLPGVFDILEKLFRALSSVG
jgi:hypothetical protein